MTFLKKDSTNKHDEVSLGLSVLKVLLYRVNLLMEEQ